MNIFGISGNRGLVKMIIVIFIALLLLAYFGFNLRNIVNSQTFQDNWSLIWTGLTTFWNDYMKAPAEYLWNIFVVYIWDPAIHNLEQMKNNEPTTVNTANTTAPQLSQQAPIVQ